MFTKKEKYSIRKFTVGAASIVFGSFMYGATSNNEASASEQEEQISKMGAETKSQLEQAPKVVGEKTKQKSEAVNNEIYTDQPLKEQKPEVIQNKPEPVQAPEEQKVDVEKPLPSNQKTNDTKVNTSNTAQTKVSNIETTPKEYKIKGVKEKSETVGAKPQPRVQKANLKDEQKIEGKDVSSKVTVEETSKIVNPNQSTQVNVVNPHNGERMQLQYRWKFDKDIKPGDYFDFDLSKNVNTHGVSIKRKIPDIKNGSLVMATGQVLDNGKIRYTFTDYIKDKVNVTANLNMNLFIDPKEVQNSGDQTISATLNNKTISTKVNVQYLNSTGQNGPNVNGSFEKLDKENKTFTHVAYINPRGNVINEASAYGRVLSGMSGTKPKNINIYEYIGSGNPPQSVYLDRSNSSLWKEVTENFKDKLTIQNDGYLLNFERLDKRYAVSYEGEYKKGNADLKFQTQVSSYASEFYPNNYSTAVWNNELVFYQNNANGNGQNGPIIDGNNFDFQEDTGNGEIHGNNQGSQEEINENKIIDIIEDTTPDGDSGQNNGNQTEEENTMPPRPVPPTPEPQPEPKPVPPTPESQPEPKPVPPTPESQPEPKPVPPTPESQPEPKPVPPTPESQPEPKPVPPTPESQPEPKPVPPTPESQPEPKPVPPTPESQPEPKPVPPTPESQPEPMENKGGSVSKTTDKTKMYKQMKELPNTGEEANKTSLFAGIFAILGSLVLFRRNRQSK
ncbi:Ig-like domain-containing protein [Staphylococcus aureus]|uniref:fibronectin-binding protein FnbA n=1 Tax=Staphylococcus aureus TaxID=1280 RepID=UPI0021D1F325|nr:Ig-like domain-containing protein [Staphylococcus aureus]UXU24836.1 Ig-like domain-containing protein [Staphylococcus aureus]UXU30172.1 Ig-like domain-containing protein [Staphylococcus aureus]UXU32942.1 Ig-like domain-containing protein [Staphylococcus aureus]